MTPEDPGVLLARLTAMAGPARRIVALAGPPGAGKSALAERLAERLCARAPGRAAVLPMDGFHYDDLLLVPRGWRARKGAPHTFDVGGLAATLARLRADAEAEVAVPLFDRGLEIARAGARVIGREARIVIVEGNWLLLAEPPWERLRGAFDLAARIVVPEPVLAARLAARWEGHGLAPAAIRTKLEENDLPNGRHVAAASGPADLLIDGTAPLP